MRIKNIGRTQPRIINTGQVQPKVDASAVAKLLGAEIVAYVGANSHNLPLPKPVQEWLVKNNNIIDEKKKFFEGLVNKTE